MSNYQFSWLAQGILAFELTKATELQLTAGYGFYRGSDFINAVYRTDIIPLDLRLRINTFDVKGWNPYLYFGAGGMNFSVKDFPKSTSPNSVNESGWSVYFPAGIGSEFAISDYVLFDFSLGGAYTLSDDLDYYRIDKIKDWMLSVNAGITFTGESGSSDRDKDGLTKNREEEIGTNRKNPDSDADGLKDGDEVIKYQTNPLQADTDLDGLSDYDEIFKYKTNPNNADTDGATVDDFTEITRGTDTLNAEDDVVKVGVPIILEGIYFETGKADITAESEFTLRKALTSLQNYPEMVIEISGHTDITGNYKKNLDLFQQRAKAVRDWLIRNGIDPARITAKGYGPDRPIASNDTPEGRQKNRRIEFTRLK